MIEKKSVHRQVEILAPAGSVESMRAAVCAGADAVYMGGSRFGARAYAENAGEDGFLEAIDYVHLHGRKLYMTVNILMKEAEMNQLFDFMEPYYRRGLDAAIVQDLGAFVFLRDCFPGLALHASTQMTITGWRGTKRMKELGAARVVTARELSLDEIRQIHEHVDIEIESFVHGALCYCYSGQCLLSSLIGGRSGNRGRCAQPCRLPYETAESSAGKNAAGKNASGKNASGRNTYLLNMKDLCTLNILPDIIEAGVCSLKIEGRMKSPRYTAGVVSVYRKYVDRYLSEGRDGYHVDVADKKMLLELFDRGGFTEGYYRQHNGRDMLALKEKPAFRETDPSLLDRLDRDYVNKNLQEPACAKVSLREGEAARLTLASGGREVTVDGAVVQTAKNQPLTADRLSRQIAKTGGSPFVFEMLETEIRGNCFLPVQALNELRRDGLEQLERAILEPYRREMPERVSPTEIISQNSMKTEKISVRIGEISAKTGAVSIHVLLEELEGLSAVLAQPDVSEVYLDSCGFDADTWAGAARRAHQAGKRCALVLPQIFRREAEHYFCANETALRVAGFDELLLRSMEEVSLVEHLGIPLVADAGLYAMNQLAADEWLRMGFSRLTLPLELNSRELAGLGCEGKEMIAYGYLPAMVSAQCITRTVKGCTHKPKLIFMKDRTGKELPVKNHCRFCYNTIYNPSPLSLLGQERLIASLSPAVLRLQFSRETSDEISRIIRAYAGHFLRGEEGKAPFADFTRGHLKRGVE